MNSAAWLAFFNILLGTPKQLQEIDNDKKQAYECLKLKRCISVYNQSIQEWSVYQLDSLQETCGGSPGENKAASDPNGACNAYYKWLKNIKE